MISVAEVTHSDRSEEIDPRAAEDFISIACHELRNPLALMLLHAEVSARRLEGSGDDPQAQGQAKESVERLRETAQHLTRMCEALLDARSLESGRRTLHNELVDVASLARSVVERYLPICERAHCNVAV